MRTPSEAHPRRHFLLLVEDNPADADLVREHLFDIGEEVWRMEVAQTLGEGLELLGRLEFSALLIDLNLPDSTGLATLDRIVTRAPTVPVIVLTGAGGNDLGIEAVARGAADFLPKGELTGELLLRSVRYAEERSRRHGVEARYRALVENSRDLVSILDPDLTLRYVSPSIRRILGYQPDEKIGVAIGLDVHPEDREAIRREMERLLAEPTYTSHVHYRIRHRDGSWRILDTIAQNCLDDPHIQGVVVNSRDVTDLREAEEAVSQTARRLERTLGALEDAVFTMETARRRIVSCNAAAEAMFGYACGDMVGRSTEILHEDEEAFRSFGEESLPALRAGTSHHTEVRMRRRDGTVFPVEITATLLRPEEGIEGGVVSVVRDITERVAQARRMRFQAALLEQVGQPVLAVDEEGRVTYWNAAAETLTGLTRDDVEGREIVEILIHEGDVETALQAREAARAGGRWQGEIRIRKKDGGVAIVQATATPAVNPDGSPGGRITAGVDITDLRRAEEESRQAAERLRLQANILEAVGQAVIATDVQDQIIYWNRAAEDLYGWSREEAIGQPVLEIALSGASRQRAEEIMDLLREGGTWSGEFDVQRRDGSTFRAMVTDTPMLDEEGRFVGVIGISSDISDRIELEERLRQATKMEAIGRLAGGVAHDFNNILTAVEGHASLLRDELPEDSPLLEDVDQVLGAGRRAADLTRQLLAFSRKQVLEERRVDLNRIAEDLQAMLRRLVPENIDLLVETAPAEAVVRADPGQLQQVLMNLVVNAVDAIDGTGRITVRVGPVELGPGEVEAIPWEIEPGPFARLAVEDTGSGMSPEVMARIFEPFFTTKPEGHGTGLGLSTVYGIVKQSAGHILVDSTPVRGTTFEVLLPRLTEAADTAAERPGPAPEAESVVVLLVEDDPAVRKVASRVLGRAGHTVLEASNGQEALALADREDDGIDLVISDVVMPDMGGVEMQKSLKAAHPGLKVVLMSGYSESELRGEIREMGMVFLPKPFTPDSLLRCVAEALAAAP